MTNSDGFTVLPNGNFLINSGDGNCEYNQYNGSTGALVGGTTIIVPGGTFCTGVDNDGTSLFFQDSFSSFIQTDMSGSLIAAQPVSGENAGIEDISLIQSVGRTPKPKKTTYKYCARKTPPLELGPSEVKFAPCMRAQTTYNGVSASSVSITPPANSKKLGGCLEPPGLLVHGASSLLCEVKHKGSYTNGSGVTAYVTMELLWDESVCVETFCLTELEWDTLTLSVTTSATGHNAGFDYRHLYQANHHLLDNPRDRAI
jgi:hypothetical protein